MEQAALGLSPQDRARLIDLLRRLGHEAEEQLKEQKSAGVAKRLKEKR